MPDTSDRELLWEYCQHGSETAFADLVQPHVNLVYSVVFRHIGMAGPAEKMASN